MFLMSKSASSQKGESFFAEVTCYSRCFWEGILREERCFWSRGLNC